MTGEEAGAAPGTAPADGCLSLVIVMGGAGPGRAAAHAADWLARRACLHGGFDVNVIDLAYAQLPPARPGRTEPRPAAVRELEPWLAEADAYVVVVARDARDAADGLRDAAEWYRAHWRSRPVGFITYETAGEPRPPDRLRQTFAAAGATVLRTVAACPGGLGLPCDALAADLLDELAARARGSGPARAPHTG
ncbi:NAD(P)H-dependent oxidoreductase [Actinomycetota bacterium Odt1-20B]